MIKLLLLASLAIRTGLAIDGQGNAHLGAIIIVEGDKITSFGSGEPPEGTEIIDLRGYTVLPGLIDSHVHITTHFGRDEARPSLSSLWGAYSARTLLEHGFTTVRTLGSPRYEDIDLRDAINEGLVPGPRLLVSGRSISDREAPGAEGDAVQKGAEPANEALLRAAVQKRLESRVDWVKVFATRSSRAGGTATHSLEQLEWAMDEATKAGIPVSTHAHAPEGARRAILAGTRTLEHGALLTDDVLDLMVERNIYYSPNLYLGEYYILHGAKFGFSEEALEWTAKFLPVRTEVFTHAVEKGVPIIFSTDANAGWVWSGETAKEFERRVAAGQSEKDAIVSTTSRAAEALLLSDRVGDLKAGLQADIVAVAGNPLEDITALGNVVFVMKAGKVFRPAPELRNGSFTTELNGFDIHYEVRGKGPVLMTVPNSWGLSLDGLRATYRPLERYVTMVYFDPRGMGASGEAKTSEDLGAAAVRLDFHALREHLGLSKVNAIGWSNGASNLMLLAAEYPETIDAAIFLHGNATFTPEDAKTMSERFPTLMQELGRFQKEMDAAELTVVEQAARVRTFDTEIWFPYMLAEPDKNRKLLRELFRNTEFSWAHAQYANVEWPAFDARDDLTKITARSLVISGAHDILPPEKGREVSAGIADARFELFTASGHFAPLEEREKFVDVVVAFLEGR